ncbi:MAG TPA: DUF5924 family protein [Verrucomicrobiae bacterium]|nr:DUF5924 family protein [Verrucomicrobiae bacterium]
MSDPAPHSLWGQLLEWLHRYRFWLAPLSFSAGLASFMLIERREWLAQWVAGLLIVGWLLIVAEDHLTRWLRLSPALLRFGVQAIQQETFFFALPFFLHTTTWTTGQGVFTGAVTLAALCSIWDPLYYGRIVARQWLAVAFHAFAVFVGTLTLTPIVLHLTTQQTLALASVAVAGLCIASQRSLIDREQLSQRLLLIAGAAALGCLAWSLRPWVPPATLWISHAQVTDALDPVARTPGLALASVSPAHLHAQGLHAFTAIHAPRGLREQVYHRWLHEGREVDRIALDIVGGRAEGYRAWSQKRGFPADPRGSWRVEVMTESGQLIGQFGFNVIGDVVPPRPEQPGPEPAPLPSPPEDPPT